MKKYFEMAFFVLLASGLLILFARLGLRGEWVSVQESHSMVVGLLGVCLFCVGVGSLLAVLIMSKEE